MLDSDPYKCIVKLGGLALAGHYPPNSTTCQYAKYKPVITIQGGKNVPKGDEKALAEAVAKQPVAVAVDASHQDFQLYKEGVYSSWRCSASKLDHVMVVVGYGTESGEDYWLCQNSWGECVCTLDAF